MFLGYYKLYEILFEVDSEKVVLYGLYLFERGYGFIVSEFKCFFKFFEGVDLVIVILCSINYGGVFIIEGMKYLEGRVKDFKF